MFFFSIPLCSKRKPRDGAKSCAYRCVPRRAKPLFLIQVFVSLLLRNNFKFTCKTYINKINSCESNATIPVVLLSSMHCNLDTGVDKAKQKKKKKKICFSKLLRSFVLWWAFDSSKFRLFIFLFSKYTRKDMTDIIKHIGQ